MPIWSWMLTVFICGALIPVQTGLNATLGRVAGAAIWGAMANFVVGSIALAFLLVVTRIPVPSWSTMSAAPIFLWTGGLLGATWVGVTTAAAPKLGAAAMIALIIAGQMCASLVIDAYGLLSFPVQEITVPRVLGALLLIAGVVLIRYC
jgi:bacterial/archaeal transporter family-2 protein